MTNILSGEQLVIAHSKTSRELPALGYKDFEPSQSWLENKQIEYALDQRKELLDEERVERQNCLMAAEWVPEIHKAEVTLKNKNWEVFGHHNDSADWLFPEEVLYLMEMNCLECLYGEVPLSIQKGYSALLHPAHGCSLHEYRVFAHLCRMGYRVARHCADLTVTAYERQIRLDQHLDQRKTYSFTTIESELPRPDLPPKTVVELPEDTEISLESRSLDVDKNVTTNDVIDSTAEERSDKQLPDVIEVLDSSDESSSDGSSSDDSDIEIIHESAPNIRNNERNYNLCDNDNDSDIEIIDMPVARKEIIVETIESSDSEKEKSSDYDSDKSYDGNWKRKQPKKKKNRYQRPSTMNHFHFLSVHEFCAEEHTDKKTREDSQSMRVENNELVNVNENSNDSESVSCSSVEPLPSSRARTPKFIVEKTRNEILDLMPSMGGQKRNLITLDAPDLRLIPGNIIPKQISYTYSMNSLKARVFKPMFGRRFRGRFGNFNSYNNNSVQSFYPNQINPMSAFTPALTQLFGSDIHSMARGMMQIASSLLLNLPQNNPTNNLTPMTQQPSSNFYGRSSNYSQHQPSSNFHGGFSNYSQRGFGSPRMLNTQHGAFDERHSRFPNSNYNSFNPSSNENPQHFRSNNTYPLHSQDIPQRSLTPYSRLNVTDLPERNFTPPPRRANIHRRGSFFSKRTHPGNQRSRNHSQHRDVHSSVPLRTVDPAYVKPDVPLTRIQNEPEERLTSFIPLRADEGVEIIEVIESGNFTPQKGISARLNRKRKKKLRKMLNKKVCLDKKVNPEIIFLDSPMSNVSTADLMEVEKKYNVSVENNVSESPSGENLNVKQESREDCLGVEKEQPTVASVKNEQCENRIKSENGCEISVKLEQGGSASNSQLEIKMESSTSNAPSLSTVPLEPVLKSEDINHVKLEPNVKCEDNKIKDESSCCNFEDTTVKPVEVSEIKHENVTEAVGGGNSIESTANTVVSQQDNDVSKETSVSTVNSEVPVLAENENTDNLQQLSNEMEEGSDKMPNDSSDINERTSNESMESEKSEISLSNVASWADVKKHNLPISCLPESISDKETDSDDEVDKDSDEIRPLIRPKHCKSIGTVLSALQIFSPFNPEVPEDISKLKISFDMYLPTEFRKSQRGLPQYRIAVFKGCEPMPSAEQFIELQSRFADNVPVLRAVVMPDSIVFYSCSSVSLSVDLDSLPRPNA